MDRFDKFTDRARKVLTLAQDEAQRFNHNYIGTEHLLLGLVREGEGVAARVLENMNVELAKVRTAVEFIIGRGDRPAVGEATTTSAPSTSCSASSGKGRASPPASSNHLGSTSTRCATRSSGSCPRARRPGRPRRPSAPA